MKKKRTSFVFSLVENFKCKLCNASYKHRLDFLHHLRTVHKLLSPPSAEPETHLQKITSPSFNALFSCKFCPMKLNSRFDLNHHLLHEHGNERQENSKKLRKNLLVALRSFDVVRSFSSGRSILSVDVQMFVLPNVVHLSNATRSARANSHRRVRNELEM